MRISDQTTHHLQMLHAPVRPELVEGPSAITSRRPWASILGLDIASSVTYPMAEIARSTRDSFSFLEITVKEESIGEF